MIDPPRRDRRLAIMIVALTALLYAPSFSRGFVVGNPYDDWLQLASLEGTPTSMATRFDLWKFYSGDPLETEVLRRRGDLPCFFPLDFRWRFWRPASSALSALDFALFGRNMLGFHVHCTLWFLLLVSLVGALFRRLVPTSLALPAMLTFALVPGAVEACCWIPARHVVVSACLAVAGLLAHLRWRLDAWRPGRLLSVAAIALALCASEAAIQTIAYLVAYELWGQESSPRDRIRAILPLLGLGLAYAALYVAIGCGVRHAEWMGYHDPVHHPLETLANARQIVPSLSFNLLSNLPLSTERQALPGLWIGGSAILAVVYLLLARAALSGAFPEIRRHVRWMTAGSLLSLLPTLPSQSGDRLLVAPAMGMALVVAVIARHGWLILRGTIAIERRRVWWIGGWLIVVVPHLLLAPAFVVGSILHAKHESDPAVARIERIATQLERAASPDAAAVVLFNSPIEPATLRSMPRPGRRNLRWWPLYATALVRTSPESFEAILPDHPPRRANFWPPRRVGEVIDLDAFRVTIKEVNAHGAVLRYEVRFPGPIDRGRELFEYTGVDWRPVPVTPPGVRLTF